MKFFSDLLFVIIVCILLVFLYIQSSNTCKVFDVINPDEILLDINQNLIIDETTPFKTDNIYYIGKENINLSDFPFIEKLSDTEKFFAAYMAKNCADKLLHNRFVKIKNNEIYINNKKYSKLLLESKYVFDDTEKSQKLFLDNIKNINLDEYVIYNEQNKKYHKLSCNAGQNVKKYKIIKLTKAEKTGKPCQSCFIENDILSQDIRSLTVQNSKFSISNNNHFKEIFEAENISIFFQDLNKIFKPSDKCNSNVCKALKKEIDNAKYTIDFAIYGINNQPVIFNALIKAKKRGVKIRWVCDFDVKNNNYYEDSEKLKKYIQDYKTDEEYEKINSSAIMHNKFFVFDNQKVWTGSSNITSTDLTDFNANYSILINSSEIAQKYTEEFNQMYNGFFHKYKKHTNTNIINVNPAVKIKALFSPQDNIINKEIIPLINKAEKYIYIPIFIITHKEMEYALINAQKRGVDIKIIIDATNAHSKYSIHKQLRKAQIKVKTENYAGKMHMKTIVIDDYITVIGSMNYTKSANNKNDENVLIIYNQEIAEYIKSTFISLWNKIPAEYEKYDVRSESKESIGSCYDGIDNNFDGKTDFEDEGCFEKRM